MDKHTNRADPLREKTLNFSIRIVKLHQFLTETKKEYIMSKQIFRSGTNPGAMVREAANAESSLDFIHKLAIAQKETGETLYWLELLYRTNYITTVEYDSINADTVEIMKLIRSSILTKKKNLAVKIAPLLIIVALIINYFNPLI